MWGKGNITLQNLLLFFIIGKWNYHHMGRMDYHLMESVTVGYYREWGISLYEIHYCKLLYGMGTITLRNLLMLVILVRENYQLTESVTVSYFRRGNYHLS